MTPGTRVVMCLPRLLGVVAVFLVTGTLASTPAQAQIPVYTQDTNLSDFTSDITACATFIQDLSGDVALPYTPTAATLNNGFRIIGNGSSPPIVVDFGSPVSLIRVFPSIDHFGSAFDGFQYSISGSSDNTTFTLLFDATSVNGTTEPFTLGSFTGTAPVRVNNVLTPGAGPGGTVGYEADFSFSQPYRFYSFGASTVAIQAGNPDQELSGVCTTPGKCPLTHGFWKNHAQAWPVTLLTLGSQTYTQAELLTILRTPAGGDASLILADQLIAAKLNIANGSNATPVSGTIADADSLLSGFSGKLPYGVDPSSATGQAMVNDAATLDSYNSAQLTPNCTP